MIKYVTVLSRRAGMSREDFSNYWKNTHAPILKEIPGLMGFVQNHALEDLEGNERLTTGSANSTSTAWRPCKQALPVLKVSRLLPTSPTSATQKNSCVCSSKK
jgi:uncharacterized protein (TIGR02118 family)